MTRHLPLALGWAAVGGVLSGAGVLAHGTDVGLALTALAAASAMWALPGGWWSRLAFAAGWGAVLVWLSGRRGEGDVLVDADPRGYLLVGIGVVLLAFAVATLRPWRAPSDPPSDPSSDPGVDPPIELPDQEAGRS